MKTSKVRTLPTPPPILREVQIGPRVLRLTKRNYGDPINIHVSDRGKRIGYKFRPEAGYAFDLPQSVIDHLIDALIELRSRNADGTQYNPGRLQLRVEDSQRVECEVGELNDTGRQMVRHLALSLIEEIEELEEAADTDHDEAETHATETLDDEDDESENE